MSNIKLKNVNGVETTYSGVTSIKVPLADGSGNAVFSEGGSFPFLKVTIDNSQTGTGYLKIKCLNDSSVIGSEITLTASLDTSQTHEYATLDALKTACGVSASSIVTELSCTAYSDNRGIILCLNDSLTPVFGEGWTNSHQQTFEIPLNYYNIAHIVGFLRDFD